MRIWLQSTSPLEDPRNRSYSESLTRGVRSVVWPGTIVDVKGIRMPQVQSSLSHYFDYLAAGDVIECGIRAAQQGYDAFAIFSSLEPGYYALRQILDIPVYSVTQAILHHACLLADNFALITFNQMLKLRYERLIREYGLADRSAGVRCYSRPEALANVFLGFDNPRECPAVKAFVEEAEKAVDDGAELVIPLDGVLNRLVVEAGVTRVKKAPVLPTAEVFVKFVETMVELGQKAGVTVSRVGLYAQPDKDKVKAARAGYGIS